LSSALSITPHPTTPGCATIVYHPAKKPAAFTRLDFQLDHFRPVIPAGWMYSTYAKYLAFKKATKYKKPFFSFVYEAAPDICGKEKPPPLGLAYNCKKSIEFKVIAIDTPHADRQWSVFVPIASIAALLSFSLLKHYK
jgi:hypothetical protein